jgi:hypothetical protein
MEQEIEQSTSNSEESIFNNLVDLEPYEKTLKNARIWLYVIAGLQFVMGIYEYFSVDDKTVASIAFAIDALIALTFLGLALWSRKKPTIAFLIALILYLVFIISLMVIDPTSAFKGIIVKIFVIIALIKANRDAKKYEAVRTSIGQ